MRKIFLTFISCLVSAALLTGCGASADSVPADGPENVNVSENNKDDDAGQNDDKAGPLKEPDENKDAAYDLTSEEGIYSYIAGEWTLIDRRSGKDHGVLAIKDDGTFKFTRLSDKAEGSGTFSFEYSLSKKGEEPDRFRMELDDCMDLLPEGTRLYGDEGTSGIFHIGTCGDKDHLYLKEIGNGDSVVSMYVFNTNEDPGQYGDWSYDWLFCRDNDTKDPAGTKEDETFYAWAWKTDEDGVWLQPMADHEFETVEEYTDWKYLGGYFNETENIGAAHYGITKDSDLSGLVDTRDWDSGYPLMVCEATVDHDGNIEKLRDVDIVMYDSYHMGDIEPEFSYRDMTFIINGYEIDITPYAPAATAIMDAERVGDWILIECHNNPNIGTYLFYNIYDGLIDYFEYQIDGANLIWQGDDLSTAVYQQYNGIYDIWGHQIGYIEDGQLYELSFKDKNTISAKCWIIDEAGREKEFTEEFEYEPCDGAVWAYFEYLLGGARQWRRLKEMAGASAALIIVDPPEKICEKMSYPVTVTEGALDKVAVVPLLGDSVIGIGSVTEEAEKGRSVVFEVTVPEGMPTDTLTVETMGHGTAEWEVWQLSGKDPQMSTFIR